MQCTAHRTNGQPCQRGAIKGANVCYTHGGAAPQVRAAARQRLLEAADRAAADLVAISRDRKQPGAVRVAAVKSILDRAGVPEIRRDEVVGADGGPIEVEYDVKRLSEAQWQQWLELLEAARVPAVAVAAALPAPDDDGGENLT